MYALYPLAVIARDTATLYLMNMVLAFMLMLALGTASKSSASNIWRDSFQRFGCKGQYDMYEIAHLERVCDECFEMFKEQEIHINCRNHCFGDATFFHCMEVGLLNEERKLRVLQAWDVIRKIE